MVTLLLGCGGPADTGPPDSRRDSVTESAPGDDTAPPDSPTDSDTAADSETAAPSSDADEDGHLSPEAGGDDCDDHDPTRFPGAEEWCDPVDHDCDGAPLAAGVCGKPQVGTSIFRPRVAVDFDTQLYGSLGTVRDLDGDGADELLVGCTSGCLESGDSAGNLVYAGGTEPWPVPAVPDGAGHAWQAQHGLDYVGYYALDPGDVDGDGVRDLAFPSHGYVEGIFVFHGPFALDASTDAMADADEVYTSEWNESWSHPTVTADFDGDGRSDFAGQMFLIGNQVFFGGTEDSVMLAWEGEDFGMLPIGDLDGDGVEDLYLNRAWISGIDLRGGDGAAPSELASGWWTFSEEDRLFMTGVPGDISDVGDWDGDGYAELGVGCGLSSPTAYRSGEVLFFGGGVTGELGREDAVGSLVGSVELQGFGEWLTAGDLDSDGIRDLVALDNYLDTWRLYPGSAGIPPFGTEVNDVSLAVEGTGLPALGGDVDGDGLDDWVTSLESNAFGVYPGWEIPWDDRQYW